MHVTSGLTIWKMLLGKALEKCWKTHKWSWQELRNSLKRSKRVRYRACLLTGKLKSYGAQEKRLLQLFRYGEINQDSVLDELNQLKKEREGDEQKIENYASTKERGENL